MTRGDVIDQADLDALALDATAVLDQQDVTRTYDVARALEGGYAPGVMTGDFTFSDPTDPATERWAWLDEINRIWSCLWGTPSGSTGNDSWDAGGFSATSARDRVENYWAGIGSSTGYAGNKIVASPGSHCFMEAYRDFNLGTNIQVFKWARAIYTREQPDFSFVSGVMMPPTEFTGDAAHHDSASKVVHTFDWQDLDVAWPTGTGAGLYGYFEFEFHRTSGSADPVLADYGIEFDSSGGGSTGSPGATVLQDNDVFYIWAGTGATRDEEWMMISTGTFYDGTGDQLVKVWLDTAGWVWSKTTFRGGFTKDVVSSALTSGSVATENIIHPRNESVKAALHVGTDVHFVDPDDMFDILTMIDLLKASSTTHRPVDDYIRASLRTVTKEYIDGYPTPPYDNLLDITTYLVDDLNNIFIDAGVSLYDSGAWSAITIRDATQWLIDLDTDDPDMIERLNRLLIEDAYGYASAEQVRRLPDDKHPPEEELLDIELAEPLGFATLTVNGSDYNMGKAHLAFPITAKVVYLCDAIPQWCYNTALDRCLPNMRTRFVNGERRGPRGSIILLDSDGAEIATTYGEPALPQIQSVWPVMKRDQVGLRIAPSSAPGVAYSVELPSAHAVGYAPYWDHDKKHQWELDANRTLLPTEWYSYMIGFPSDLVSTTDRMEFSAKNRNVTVYVVEDTGTFDPVTPAVYLFAKTNGKVVWPDDFTDASLDPTDYLGVTLYYYVKNTSSASRVIKTTRSTFYASGNETGSLPDPEPVFFPPYEPEIETAGFGYPQDEGIFAGDSARFGPMSDTTPGSTGLTYPVPQRGYMLRDVVIQRRPVRNSAGIWVLPDSGDTETRTVHIGLMTGAGVISGAIHGAFPGIWVELDSFSVSAGVNELRETLMWPVLEGAPLAYHVTGGDNSEEFTVEVLVDFQPAVNLSFTVDSAVTPLLGSFNGPPFLSNTWGWHQNYNAPLDGDTWTGQPGVHRDGKNDVIPPVSAKAFQELADFVAGTI